ncbi:MipA/OmpV family protein [Psychrobacter sp. FDAARGOS_221]|uniref:MipA/OmpV family protein n=1 Tax=Psychrobacter sp. FDAARGOS_221 TaxID=1975705 RepID=UPI000BB59373|nr:MipA/OmpV family protein [Psychrobacter sp. FDAARGOS_221]PNK60029.1 MipA/OmpV family protein [Psychrobacter sp. FDAARGOS_221]
MIKIAQTTVSNASPNSLATSFLAASLTLAYLASTQAQAEDLYGNSSTTDADKIGLQIGANVIANKSAYDLDDTQFSVLPSAFYEGEKVYARGSQFGGYLFNDGTSELSAYVEPTGPYFDPDEARGDLKNLSKRKWSALVGASYLYRSPIGGFRGQVATDVSGHSDGTVARLTYIARLNPGNWTIYPSAGVEWNDKNYNEYYYGVDNKESAKSGVNRYEPSSSFSPYLSVNGMYTINNDWDVFLGQKVTFLADEQRDSPMVDDRVDYRTTLGLLYKF